MMRSLSRVLSLLVTLCGLLVFHLPAMADDPYSGLPGSVDLRFGEWGLGLATLPGDEHNAASDFAVDSLGRIVVGGAVCEDWNVCYPVLMRFTGNGHRDHSDNWGDDAMVMLSDGNTGGSRVVLAPAESDGWWAAWKRTHPMSEQWHLVKLDAEGSFVPGFEPGDLALGSMHTIAGLHHVATAEGDYLIVIASNLNFATGESSVEVRRLRSADGELDTSFGNGDGILDIQTDNYYFIHATAVYPNGRILIHGSAHEAGELLTILPDGSGFDADFGNGGAVDISDLVINAFAADGVVAETMTSNVGMRKDGDLLVGVAIYSEEKFQAAVVAVDGENGTIDQDFGNGNGYVIHPLVANADLFGLAFAVDPETGGSVFEVQYLESLSAYPVNAMLYFTSEGAIDPRYGSNGALHQMELPGENSLYHAKLAYDRQHGVLAINMWPVPDPFDSDAVPILGLNGFGAMRFLGADEHRTYDATPDAVPETILTSVPNNGIVELLRSGFPSRDVAVDVVSGIGGAIGSSEEDAHNYCNVPSGGTCLPVHVILPVGVEAHLFHQAGHSRGMLIETEFTAGGIEFTLGSVTADDDDPEPLVFDPLQDIAAETFVFSTPAELRGIDMRIHIRRKRLLFSVRQRR